MGGEGEGSGVKGGGKWGWRGREVGIGYPLSTPSHFIVHFYKSKSITLIENINML